VLYCFIKKAKRGSARGLARKNKQKQLVGRSNTPYGSQLESGVEGEFAKRA